MLFCMRARVCVFVCSGRWGVTLYRSVSRKREKEKRYYIKREKNILKLHVPPPAPTAS